jgi:predicted ester cyclase
MRMLLIMVFVLGSQVTALASDPEANKALYRRWIEEVWHKRQPDALDPFVAPDFIEHNANIPPGIEGRKRFIRALLAGFSDYRPEVQALYAEGDIVVARVQWTGTQDGPFLGRPATGNKLRFSTADFYRIKDGKFVEHWDVVDSLPRAIALGIVPAPK